MMMRRNQTSRRSSNMRISLSDVSLVCCAV
jgi:hypothetical protein